MSIDTSKYDVPVSNKGQVVSLLWKLCVFLRYEAFNFFVCGYFAFIRCSWTIYEFIEIGLKTIYQPGLLMVKKPLKHNRITNLKVIPVEHLKNYYLLQSRGSINIVHTLFIFE